MSLDAAGTRGQRRGRWEHPGSQGPGVFLSPRNSMWTGVCCVGTCSGWLHFADTIWQRKNVKALFGGPESFQKKDDSPLVFPAFPLSAGLRGVLWGKH